MPDLKVVGIDPSVTATGIAFADGSTVTVKEKGLVGDKRLLFLYLTATSALKGVDLAIIEDVPVAGHGAGHLGKAQGVIRLALQQQEIPYVAIPPATLKKAATGKGNAKKDAMRSAMEDLVGEQPKSVDDNQVDAWFLRECGLHLIGQGGYVHVDGEPALEKYREELDLAMSGRSRTVG